MRSCGECRFGVLRTAISMSTSKIESSDLAKDGESSARAATCLSVMYRICNWRPSRNQLFTVDRLSFGCSGGSVATATSAPVDVASISLRVYRLIPLLRRDSNGRDIRSPD
jgi:hypothetical protein